jgi:AcrR family transcriptional regulator
MQHGQALAILKSDDDTASPRTDADARGPDDSAKWRQIIDGARKVFMADGFDGASMNEIARVAGVSKGTLYVYFDSKVALFEAFVRDERRQQAEQSCKIEYDAATDVRTALVAFGTSLAEMITRPETIAHTRTVIAVAAKFPQVGRAFFEAGPQVGFNRISKYLRLQTEAGVLAIDDIAAAAEQLTELCIAGTLKRMMFCVVDRFTPEEIAAKVEASVDVFLRAYLSPKAR